MRPALVRTSPCNALNGYQQGWDSMWGRFMDRVLSETKVTQRFTEHDLCAKVASDAESLERARALLSTPIPAQRNGPIATSWSVSD